MITIDLSALAEFLKAVVEKIDVALIGRVTLAVLPLLTSLFAAASAKGKRKKFSFSATAFFLLAGALYFSLAAADAVYGKRYFSSLSSAAIAAATVFLLPTAFYVCFHFALLKGGGVASNETKERFVARICEEPIAERTVKAYPLVGSFGVKLERSKAVDYGEFEKFLRELSEKDLSFFDKKEYNRIERRAAFLRGVAVTDDTAPDFNEVFASVVKLGARYGLG